MNWRCWWYGHVWFGYRHPIELGPTKRTCERCGRQEWALMRWVRRKDME